MVQITASSKGFSLTPPVRLFHPVEARSVVFPIQSVFIDSERLQAKRALVPDTVDAMPGYLLKPEIIALLDAEKHPTYRLILDAMWNTGARISDVLPLTPRNFMDDGYDFSVNLRTLKQHPRRPTNAALQPSPNRYVPIVDHALQNRVQSFLYAGHFKKIGAFFRWHNKS